MTRVEFDSPFKTLGVRVENGVPFVACLTDEGLVYVDFETGTKKVKSSFQNTQLDGTSQALSYSGELFALSQEEGVQLIETKNWKLIATLPANSANSVSFSRDDRYLAVGARDGYVAEVAEYYP